MSIELGEKNPDDIAYARTQAAAYVIVGDACSVLKSVNLSADAYAHALTFEKENRVIQVCQIRRASHT